MKQLNQSEHYLNAYLWIYKINELDCFEDNLIPYPLGYKIEF